MIDIRAVTRADLDAITEIENLSFPFPSSRQTLESELANEVSRFLTALCDGTICGYILFWIVTDEVHLVSIAVHPRYRRQKVASKLFQFMLDYVKPGAKSIYLEVRPGNAAAVEFYRKVGFEETGRRKKYYPDGEDAVLMKLCIH